MVGAGAIGSTFAAELLRTGRHDVVMVARTPRTELVMVTPDGSTTFDVPVVTGIDDPEPLDWVLVATKANQTDAVAPLVTALSGPSTRVLALQNGVEARARLGPHVGEDAVVECVVQCPAERLPDGTVRRRGPAQLVLADDDAGRELQAMYAGSEADITLTDDLTTALWRKLCVNAAGGGITGLTVRSMGVLHEPRVRELAATLIAECAAVGRAHGARLDADDERAVLDGMLAQPADATTSMMRSRRDGEPVEHDAITGAVFRAAARTGVDVPVTTVVDTLLAATSPSP